MKRFIDNIRISDGFGKVEYFLLPLIAISTSIFSVGMSVNFFIYVSRGMTINAILDGISAILLVLTWVLLRSKQIDSNRAMVIHVSIITVNLCASIALETIAATPDARLWVSIAMAFGMIPVIIAGTTTIRILPFAVSAAILISYLSAAIALGDTTLISQLPTFILLYLGLSLAYTYILHIARRIEHENIRMTREQENVMDYFYFTPRQWEQIRAGRMDRSKFNENLRRMERNDRERSLLKSRQDSDESKRIKDSILSRHPRLTAGDAELCRLIVQGYSTSDISRIQGLNLQSITSRRSRLRAKLGLKPGQNLNEYLRGLVGGEGQP